MAALTAVSAKHATLSTTVVDTITFSGTGDVIEVINRSGTNALYVTVNGSTPTDAGDDTFCVPGVVAGTAPMRTLITGRGRYNAPVVKIIGSANAYSVQLQTVRR